MQVDVKTLVNALPVVTLVVAGIFSYSNVTSSTEQNAEEIEDNTESIEVVENDVKDLQLTQAKLEMKVTNIEGQVTDIKADTALILTMMRESTK